MKYPASTLVWETIYMAWGSHMSNFHRVTQYGSKIHHGSMVGVTCDTTCHRSCQLVFAVSKNNPPSVRISFEMMGVACVHKSKSPLCEDYFLRQQTQAVMICDGLCHMSHPSCFHDRF